MVAIFRFSPVQSLQSTYNFSLALLIATVALFFVGASPCLALRLGAEIVTTTGLSNPVFGAAPAGQTGVLYVSERNANRIQILDLATKQFSTFLDLPDIPGGQAGLSAFAFHPDYANNGKFYLNLFDSADKRVKILEYQRSSTDPLQADILTQREILSFENASAGHNGGWLGFSPVDNMLYVATGDGGALGTGDDGLPAQDTNSLKGKILRIDVDGDDFAQDDTRNYAIPGNNPFATGGGAPEVFAVGLRHPFRASFDREAGDLYIGDVGSNLYEEVNFLPANTDGEQNFGWRYFEGPFPNPRFSSDPIPTDAIDPIHFYSRGSGAAVAGGYVYRGSEIPDLTGKYIFADIVRDTFATFSYDGTSVENLVNRSQELAHPTNSSNYALIVSFAEDANGELYFLDTIRGDIFKIVETPVLDGDYNHNGIVDAADYTKWLNTLGSTSDLLADGDGSGTVDEDDYDFWFANFGANANDGSGSGDVVPEPNAGLLALSVFLASLVARGRVR